MESLCISQSYTCLRPLDILLMKQEFKNQQERLLAATRVLQIQAPPYLVYQVAAEFGWAFEITPLCLFFFWGFEGVLISTSWLLLICLSHLFHQVGSCSVSDSGHEEAMAVASSPHRCLTNCVAVLPFWPGGITLAQELESKQRGYTQGLRKRYPNSSSRLHYGFIGPNAALTVMDHMYLLHRTPSPSDHRGGFSETGSTRNCGVAFSR